MSGISALDSKQRRDYLKLAAGALLGAVATTEAAPAAIAGAAALDARLAYRKLHFRSDNGLVWWWLQGPKYGQVGTTLTPLFTMLVGTLQRVRLTADGGYCPPWLIDRLLRNLLIDVTGNTHRAEFCIDKLYSPDGPTGRLGLLEMRAFEMPPHARMSLTQQLLMRALVSRFWKEPYRPARLKRWSTELHDRFMLPHFIWQDLCDVVEELNAFGYALKADWFAPHLNFRFPRLGDFTAMGSSHRSRASRAAVRQRRSRVRRPSRCVLHRHAVPGWSGRRTGPRRGSSMPGGCASTRPCWRAGPDGAGTVSPPPWRRQARSGCRRRCRCVGHQA